MTCNRWTMGLVVSLSGSALGCAPSDAARADEVSHAMRASIADELTTWHDAAVALMNAAPTPTGRGWDPVEDAKAIAAMKAAWVDARSTYERIEGAVAPIFPDLDASTDARYDDFLAQLGGQKDPDLFDDQGVTGMHAIERILYSDQIPQRVVDFEKGLPGYTPAAFPGTEAEAQELKTRLCKKLVTDIETMQAQWAGADLDLAGAFGGLISLMNEQREKVMKAATGQEESRYSQRTLADVRDNLTGTRAIYALFTPWLMSKSGTGASGVTIDGDIQSGFDALGTAYSADPGVAFPTPPDTWSSVSPTAADLATPFGKLYSVVNHAVDPTRQGSVVDEMNAAATLLGYPQFVEAP
jgi:iron uptake system component EfeO